MSDKDTKELLIRIASVQMRHSERIMYLIIWVIALAFSLVILLPVLRGDAITIYVASWAIPVALLRWIFKTRKTLFLLRKSLDMPAEAQNAFNQALAERSERLLQKAASIAESKGRANQITEDDVKAAIRELEGAKIEP